MLKVNYLIILTILLVLLTGFENHQLKKLSDGTYKVVYKHSTLSKIKTLEITGDLFQSISTNGLPGRGKIRWINESRFSLEYENTIPDSSSLFSNILTSSSGFPVYEIYNQKADSFYFKISASGNLNIEIANGVLIRQ